MLDHVQKIKKHENTIKIMKKLRECIQMYKTCLNKTNVNKRLQM